MADEIQPKNLNGWEELKALRLLLAQTKHNLHMDNPGRHGS